MPPARHRRRRRHGRATSAVRSRYIPSNPAKGTPLPRLPHREQQFLAAHEVDQLADAVPDRYRTWVYVMAYTGIRFGESVALKKERCQLLRNRLYVVETVTEVGGQPTWGTPKNHRARHVIVPAFVKNMLAEHIVRYANADGLVFTSPNGELMRATNFRRRVWKPACGAVGLDGLRIHDLRHTCASLMIRAGAKPKQVQHQLGHSSIAISHDLYGHLFEDDWDDLADRLNDLANPVHALGPDRSGESAHRFGGTAQRRP